MRRLALATAGFALSSSLVAQATTTTPRPDSSRRQAADHMPKRSRADTLRGSFTTRGRKWWEVTFYDLHVTIQPNDSSIAGYDGITYTVLEPARTHGMRMATASVNRQAPGSGSSGTSSSSTRARTNGSATTSPRRAMPTCGCTKASRTTSSLIKPTETWQTATVHLGNPSDFRVDDNFYVVPKAVDATSRP